MEVPFYTAVSSKAEAMNFHVFVPSIVEKNWHMQWLSKYLLELRYFILSLSVLLPSVDYHKKLWNWLFIHSTDKRFPHSAVF